MKNIRNKTSADAAIADLIVLIQHIKIYISDESDMSWTGYRSAGKLREKLDNVLVKLQKGNLKVLDKIKFEFLPTSSFCEHSLSNGWSDEYNNFADRFDILYKTLKNKN